MRWVKNKKVVSLFCVVSLLFGLTNSENVFTKKRTVKKIILNITSKKMKVGEKVKLKVKKVKPLKASKKVKWKSSNKKIATVSKSGVVKAKKVGKAKITATSTTNKRIKAVCRIQVKKKSSKNSPNSTVKNETPTKTPTDNTTPVPTNLPQGEGTGKPTATPTNSPGGEITGKPTATPTNSPGGDTTEKPTATPTAEPNYEPMLEVSSVNARPGDTDVTVALSVKNNPGILGMTLGIKFNQKAMTLKSVENGSALKDVLALTKGANLQNGCKFIWDGQELQESHIKDGEVLVLSFDISDDAAPGNYAISFYYNDGDIVDKNLEAIGFEMKSGNILIG